MLGVDAFFIARSGLMSFAGTQAEPTIQSAYLFATVSFLAGFSSHKFLAWLDRLADKAFGAAPAEKLAEDRQAVAAASASDAAGLRAAVASAPVLKSVR